MGTAYTGLVMVKIPYVIKQFDGGWSTDLKIGIKNSFAYSQSLDFRKKPSQLSVLPGPTREDNGVIKDLIQNEVMTADGTIYAIGDAGAFYKRTTAGAWSKEADTGHGTFGISYRQDADNIYLAGRKSISLFSGVSGTPAMYMNYHGPTFTTHDNSAIVGFNVSCYQSSSSQTYQPPTAINENSVNLRYFQSDIEPLQRISVFVVSKGTGDWTLTLHDGLNHTLGSATVTNANVSSNNWNDFVFSSATNGQVRIYIDTPSGNNARTYHVHVTSTVADGALSTLTLDDLSQADLQIWADRLVQTNNGMHPWVRFEEFECIGNGNYLSTWQPVSDPESVVDTSDPTSVGVFNTEFERHTLAFPLGYEVCGLATTNEFLVIAAEQNTSASTSIPQAGILFFWDGVSPTYNYFVVIAEGSPYGLHTYQNTAYYYANGAWYGIASPTTLPVKLRTMPGSDTEYSGSTAPIQVYPFAATVRRGIHLMAYPSMTTNTGINYGVYSWGAIDKNWPDSFGYSYLLSTGSTNYSAGNNLTIGMVKSFGDLLHISWRDSSATNGYGMDVVTNSSTPAAFSSFESLIFDNGYTAKQKKGIYVQATFTSLPSDTSFKLKYKINRRSTWQYSSAFTVNTSRSRSFSPTAGYARLDITSPSEFYEIQCGIDITSGTTTPTFTSLTLLFDDNREQNES